MSLTEVEGILLNPKKPITEGGSSGKERKKSGKETLFVGIDLHKRTWHVTGFLKDTEVFSKGIQGKYIFHLLLDFVHSRTEKNVFLPFKSMIFSRLFHIKQKHCIS